MMSPNFDKKNPFTVPDGYFEDFAAKMASMTQVPMPTIAWYRKTKSWIAVAAALSGILIGAKLMFPVGVPTQSASQPMSVEESYILNQMDESAIVSYLCDADASTQSTK